MTKKESMAILLACKKHNIFLTVRNDGDDHLVGFLNKLEISNFDQAKLITNGLVIEGRLKKGALLSREKEHPITEPLRHISKSERRNGNS
ncbi:MAG: hypothetical protein CVT99_02245 [Bacteroidetes bacterium HGW-Bacteroidetes-16]|jgi:hypothetical protein|nr:MAG: hypothetical protein CVT99_02245 [Bacteroidetes bacterium HGW-Bacteroidetes-16]